jgi:hypothetical protein
VILVSAAGDISAREYQFATVFKSIPAKSADILIGAFSHILPHCTSSCKLLDFPIRCFLQGHGRF